MSAYALKTGETLRIEPGRGTTVHIAGGNVWLTQHQDPQDYMLAKGASLALNGKGTTLVKAYEPTLLELYRADPVGVRGRIARAARRERAEAMHGLLASLLKVFSRQGEAQWVR
jgi:DUF2917 family protein